MRKFYVPKDRHKLERLYNGSRGPGVSYPRYQSWCKHCVDRGWYVIAWGDGLVVRACRICQRGRSWTHAEAARCAFEAGILCSPEDPHRIEDDDLMDPWESRI